MTAVASSSSAQKRSPDEPLPLHCEWQMWAKESTSAADWNSSQTMIGSFKTIEEFWVLARHLPAPSDVSAIEYSLFRKGVIPDWNDRTCAQGGRWKIVLNKYYTRNGDEIWKRLMFGTIGEHFDDCFVDSAGEVAGQVCGVKVIKKKYSVRFELWLSCTAEDVAMACGQEFKALLHGESTQMTELADLAFDGFKAGEQLYTLNAKP